MTATNHALTGAVIGLSVGPPLLAVGLALLSHFICDIIPHFGLSDKYLNSRLFGNILAVDAGLCLLIVLFLAGMQPAHWLLASACAFVATSPDLLWIGRFRAARQNRPWQANRFLRFAEAIQLYQRPPGAVVEVIWAGVFSMLLWQQAILAS